MPRQKYDLVQLKQDFFSSEYSDVKSFLSNLGIYQKINNQKTRGWNKEKRENKEQALSKAMQKSITKQANALEIPIEQLSLAKKNAVVKVIQQMMNKDLNMHDLDRTIRILRTEMGLPVTYTKSENLNIEKVEGIHIIMGAKPVQSD